MPVFKRFLRNSLIIATITASALIITWLEQSASPSLGRNIVYFKNDLATIPATELTRKGLGVLHTIDSIDAAVVQGSRPQLLALSSDVRVDRIERDEQVSLRSLSKSGSPRKAGKPFRIQVIQVKALPVSTPAQTDWGIQAVRAERAWNAGFTGKGVKIAIVDTGIAPHPDLKIAGGTSFVDYTDSYTDDNGHGTHVAGIIGGQRNNIGSVGIAHGASLYAVKVLDKTGDGFISDVMLGMDWAISKDMNIINLSLGSESEISGMQQLITRAAQRGIFVVCSSGNEGFNPNKPDNVNFPAKNKETIAVAAVDRNMNWATFSSTGPKVEVSAPGDEIFSTFLNNGYSNQSGTSMASPYVAGQLALLMETFPGASMNEIRTKLQTSVRDRGPVGRDKRYGYGIIQTVNADPNQTITASSNKKAYARNQTALFSVKVNKIKEGSGRQPVTLVLQMPNASVIRFSGTTNPDGEWSTSYKIPASALNGNYTLIATMANGAVISAHKAVFQVK